MFEYLVEEVRDGMPTGAMSANYLQELLNDRAEQGWRLNSMITLDARNRPQIPADSRHGPGRGGSLLVTFERQTRM